MTETVESFLVRGKSFCIGQLIRAQPRLVFAERLLPQLEKIVNYVLETFQHVDFLRKHAREKLDVHVVTVISASILTIVVTSLFFTAIGALAITFCGSTEYLAKAISSLFVCYSGAKIVIRLLKDLDASIRYDASIATFKSVLFS